MSTSLVGAKTGDVQELAIGRRMKKDAFAAIIERVEGAWKRRCRRVLVQVHSPVSLSC
jgi:hypothetical protein